VRGAADDLSHGPADAITVGGEAAAQHLCDGLVAPLAQVRLGDVGKAADGKSDMQLRAAWRNGCRPISVPPPSTPRQEVFRSPFGGNRFQLPRIGKPTETGDGVSNGEVYQTDHPSAAVARYDRQHHG
jgi:hypothetical protein